MCLVSANRQPCSVGSCIDVTRNLPSGLKMTPRCEPFHSRTSGFAPLALQHAKRVLNDDGAYEDQRPEHKDLFERAWSSQDVIEAQVARIENRPPRFQGA